MLYGMETFCCNWMRHRCVNLLKVDVERAELDVLLGVQPRHWPLIQQVAMEVSQAAEHVVGSSSCACRQ